MWPEQYGHHCAENIFKYLFQNIQIQYGMAGSVNGLVMVMLSEITLTWWLLFKGNVGIDNDIMRNFLFLLSWHVYFLDNTYKYNCRCFGDMKVDIWCSSLTHWGRVTHNCVSKLTIIVSDNGLSPGWRQAIIRSIAGILWIESVETIFSEILIKIHAFSFRKMHLKMSSGKWLPSCLGINVLIIAVQCTYVICHDDIMTWKCSPHYWPFVRGIHWMLPQKGPAMRSFDVFFVNSPNKLLN